jgi:hypothetical protein
VLRSTFLLGVSDRRSTFIGIVPDARLRRSAGEYLNHGARAAVPVTLLDLTLELARVLEHKPAEFLA